MMRKILHELVAERNSLQCIGNSVRHRVRLVEVIINKSKANPIALLISLS
jgi:hypothetical protein